MTRINVIHPSWLSDKHLGAEYRELPRVFGLVRAAAARGEHPHDKRNPQHYVLGTGHVRFFYPRLSYLVERYKALCEECRKRGRAVNYGSADALVAGIHSSWLGGWTPSEADVALNVFRINDRGGLRKQGE